MMEPAMSNAPASVPSSRPAATARPPFFLARLVALWRWNFATIIAGTAPASCNVFVRVRAARKLRLDRLVCQQLGGRIIWPGKSLSHWATLNWNSIN